MNKKISNSIIYNVYPTSFYDSNGDGIGDLKGITQKLDYIKQFADIVWVNPVYKSPFRDGGYDVQDYYQIDENFGTMEDVVPINTDKKPSYRTQAKKKVELDNLEDDDYSD